MRSRLLAAAAAATLPFALAGVAGAQTPAGGEFRIDPTSGPAGTEISVEGVCGPVVDATAPEVFAGLFSDAVDEPLDVDFAELPPTGTFQLTLVVPDDAAPGTLAVVVECFEGESEDEEPFFSDEKEFTVTGAQPQPTQTASPQPTATSSPTAEPAPAAQPKAAATAVKKQPTFTG